MADQVSTTAVRIATKGGLLVTRTVDRPTPEDFFRHFFENSINAQIRGITDGTPDLQRAAKDLVIEDYFVVR